MPSDRKQLNVRLDDEMQALLDELVPLAATATGLKVSQSDVVRLALQSLAREYRENAAGETAAELEKPPPKKPKGKR